MELLEIILFTMYGKRKNQMRLSCSTSWYFFLTRAKILDKQKKEKIDGNMTPLIDKEDSDEKTLELGLTARRKTNTKKT